MDDAQIKIIKDFVFEEHGVIDFDDDLYKQIRDRTIESLRNKEVTVSYEHGAMLSRMAMTMSNLNYKQYPIIITARPGLGKTQMLKASLIEKLRAGDEDKDYSAIVVINRVEDARTIKNEINGILKNKSCWVRPSFALMTLGGKKCDNGHIKKDYFPTICRSDNCSQSGCEVKSWRKDFNKHAVVFITSEFFQHLIDDDELNDLMQTDKLNLDEIDPELHYLYDPLNEADDGTLKYYRSELIIDENPGMIFKSAITNRMLNDCKKHLDSNNFSGNLIKEYTCVMAYASTAMAGASDYEYLESIGQVPVLSDEFRAAWNANPHPDHFDMPQVLNYFAQNGGIRQNGNKWIDYAIGISEYRKLINLPFRVVILDGTGLRDLTYKPDDFYILDVPDFRDHGRANLHVYPKRLSKSFYRDKKRRNIRIEEVAKEAIRVLGDRPSLFISYKELENKFADLLKEHPNIMVDHFGNLIGENKYHKCTAVFFAGMNDWGTFEYFLRATEISEKKLDLSTVQQQPSRFVDPLVSEFYQTLLALGVYQDLMRSNLRVVSDTDPVDVYMWTDAGEVVQQITEWLPKVKEPIIEAVPGPLVGEKQPKPITTRHKRILDNYKSTLSEDDISQRPKLKSIGLTKALGEIPSSAEYEYIWGPIKHGHYSRIKGHAENWLNAQKEL
ncbi:MAG: hypothetical protein HQ556_06640 [Candidatus Marinimicrobia bacterium]|nr:hypothetical protein [Candidatus Neomarinimicrobiota bacterium]